MTPSRRWLIIGGLLAATLAAAAWVQNAADDPDSEVVTEAPTAKTRTAPSASTPSSEAVPRTASTHIDLERLARTAGTPERDPFALPAPKVKKRVTGGARTPAPPPPPPSAPPVPFTYMGKLRSGSDTAVFLTQGDRNLVLREGDVIDSTYRVEQIADAAITLVYLPLDERQTIPIGEPK